MSAGKVGVTPAMISQVKERLLVHHCCCEAFLCSFGVHFRVSTTINGGQVGLNHVVCWPVVDHCTSNEQLVEIVSQGLNDDLRMDRGGGYGY